MSLLEAASLSQLETVLLDVACLGRLEATALGLEEALPFCLLNREGDHSLFIFVSLLENRERATCLSLSLGWKESSLYGREGSSTTKGGTATRLLEPRGGSPPLSLR